MVIIYGLQVSERSPVQYVGKTTLTLEARRRQHVRKKGSHPLVDWVRLLKTVDLEPEIVVLAEAGDEVEGRRLEREWIARLAPRLNVNARDERPRSSRWYRRG